EGGSPTPRRLPSGSQNARLGPAQGLRSWFHGKAVGALGAVRVHGNGVPAHTVDTWSQRLEERAQVCAVDRCRSRVDVLSVRVDGLDGAKSRFQFLAERELDLPGCTGEAGAGAGIRMQEHRVGQGRPRETRG